MLLTKICAPLLAMLAVVSPPSRAADLPVLSDKGKPFSFVVLGDIHYTPPEYKVAPFIHQLAKEIGADGYGEDAQSGVELVKRIMGI